MSARVGGALGSPSAAAAGGSGVSGGSLKSAWRHGKREDRTMQSADHQGLGVRTCAAVGWE